MKKTDISPVLREHIRHSIKTALACLLSYVVSYMLGSHYVIWAVVTSIIVMQGHSVADSMQSGLNRLSGMGLGAIVGVLLLVFFSSSNYLLVALSIFLVTLVGAYITRYGTRYMLASIGTCTVLLAGVPALADHGRIGAIWFSLGYVGEIAVGAGCAFLVSFFVWPVRMVDKLREDFARQSAYCAETLQRLTEAFLSGPQQLSPHLLVGIGMQSRQNPKRLAMVQKNESFLYRYEHAVMEIQALAIERTIDAMHTLLDNLNEYEETPYDFEAGPEIAALSDRVAEALRHLGNGRPEGPRPELARALTGGVAALETQFDQKHAGALLGMPMHRMMQLVVCAQTLRQLAEEVLLALYQLDDLEIDPRARRRHSARSARREAA